MIRRKKAFDNKDKSGLKKIGTNFFHKEAPCFIFYGKYQKSVPDIFHLRKRRNKNKKKA